MKRIAVTVIVLVLLLFVPMPQASAHATCDTRDHWHFNVWKWRTERWYLDSQEPIIKSGDIWLSWRNYFRNERTGQVAVSGVCYK